MPTPREILNPPCPLTGKPCAATCAWAIQLSGNKHECAVSLLAKTIAPNAKN